MSNWGLFLRKKSFVTWLLIVLNVGMYALMCTQGAGSFLAHFWDGPTQGSLILFGAKDNGLIALGQWYRLFAPMFLHANLVHLIVNMVGLWSVGRILELLAGSKRLFILYVVSGITGNLCSFAFIPNLSVGASSSLFGVLFCLYVLQKYEEYLAKRFHKQSMGLKLGPVLLFNAILNIVFGFSFPIFDWGAHLGGAIAGTLFGFGLVTKHGLKFQGDEPKRFFARPAFYFCGLIFINVLFACAWFQVKPYQKIAGLGFLQAARNTTPVLTSEDLSTYRDLLIMRNPETDPMNLLAGAARMLKEEKFLASYHVFRILNEFYSVRFGSPDFLKIETKVFMDQATGALTQGGAFQLNSDFAAQNAYLSKVSNEELCARSAHLFKTLGFYRYAGGLFVCALSLNANHIGYVTEAVESFQLAGDAQDLNQLLSLVASRSR